MMDEIYFGVFVMGMGLGMMLQAIVENIGR